MVAQLLVQELLIQLEAAVEVLVQEVPGGGGAGGSGVVVIKELNKAGGVWSMQSQYEASRGGTWPDGTTTPNFVSATGGCISYSGDYKIHKFLVSSTLTICGAGNPIGSSTVDYMVVAGGGGGSAPPGLYGGGGGAGGFRESPGTASGSYSVSPLGTSPAVALPVVCGPFTITVGGGGAVRTPGDPSTFSTITSTGGGTGGITYNPGAGGPLAAGAGGSGGGLGNWPGGPGAGGAGNSPPTDPPQGYGGAAPGGEGGGGGGGATSIGVGGPSPANGGNGGNGATTSISGCATTYAGGGGGSAWKGTGGTGGPGGGGNGSTGGTCAPTPAPQTVGGTNTGGGGGSGGSDSGSGPGCNSKGGPGIVIIRYKYQ